MNQPIISLTIAKAIESNLFTNVYVSTDSKEIAEISERAGAEVPFLRTPELSDNYTGTLEVIQDFINKKCISDDLVTCIYPVTPLLSYESIRESLELILSSDVDYVFPALKASVSEERTFDLGPGGSVKLRQNARMSDRTQDLRTGYFDAGQFYVGKTSAWASGCPIIGARSIALPMKTYDVIDIDNEEDWAFAEELYTLRAMKESSTGTIRAKKEDTK
jgi:N-acylneuraminate cytidylyltransferase